MDPETGYAAEFETKWAADERTCHNHCEIDYDCRAYNWLDSVWSNDMCKLVRYDRNMTSDNFTLSDEGNRCLIKTDDVVDPDSECYVVEKNKKENNTYMEFKHPPQGMIDLRPIKKKTNNPAPNGILADFFSYGVFSGDMIILDLNKANTT